MSFGSNLTRVGFTDPFRTLGHTLAPMAIRELMLYAERIFMFYGRYSNAIARKVKYFLTEPVFEGDGFSDKEATELSVYLQEHHRIISFAGEMSMDKQCYGNSYATLLVPFKRFLVCTGRTAQGQRHKICGFRRLLSEAFYSEDFEFRFPNFYSVCPICKIKTQNDIDDKRDDRADQLKLKRWSPHEIDILYDPYSTKCHYLWRIPEEYKNDIKGWKPNKGLHLLENIPKNVLKAIALNTQFRFNDDAIFHMKDATYGGIENRGYGIPRVLGNLQTILNVQVIRKQHEAICMDFVVPLRVVSPSQQITAPVGGEDGHGTQSPYSMLPGANIASSIGSMLARWRRDPASIQIAPFPIQMQLLGGNAQQLAPKDLLEYGEAGLMDEVDVPAEMWRGSMQLQAMPIAIRLFESSNKNIPDDHNAFLRWSVKRIQQELNGQVPSRSYFKPVTIVDDEQKRQLLLQLFAGGQVTGRRAYKALDMEWRQEQEGLADEAVEMSEIQADTQRKMDQRGLAGSLQPGATGSAMMGAQGGGAAGGPAGAAGGAAAGAPADPSQAGMAPNPKPVTSYLQQTAGRVPNDPQELQALADSMSTQLVETPEPDRNSELSLLRRFNEFLHELVTKRMEKYRSKIRSEAGNQAISQLQGGGGAAPPPQ